MNDARGRRAALLAVMLCGMPAAHVVAQGLQTKVVRGTVAYLVRHGEKVGDGTADPHLSPAGEARARALEALLRDSSIATIVVTQYQRTRETAMPFLAAHPVSTITLQVAGNTMQAYTDSVASIIARTKGRVLVIGHSNTIPLLIAALGGPRGTMICDGQYADLFVVRWFTEQPTATVTRSHYGAADPPGADRCP